MYRMNFVILATVLGLFVGYSPAVAQAVAGEKSQTVEGVKSVNIEAKSFLFAANGEDITMWVTEATRYLVDGEPAEMHDALQPGSHIIVTHSESIALRVEAVASEPDRDLEIENEDPTRR